MGKAARINGRRHVCQPVVLELGLGLIGVLVAVPIMMVIKSICDRSRTPSAVGEFV
jgi:hypothetical protein